MITEEYTYCQFKRLSLKASLYRCQSHPLNKTLLYFHGGGLMYGSRNDMPEQSIQALLDSGYHFLAFDYPLAPESNIDDIVDHAKKAVKWFIKESTNSLFVDSSDYILFGRSAGAYLCFLMASDKSLPAPECIIDFYGYDSLEYGEFKKPSPHYSRYPKLAEAVVKRIIQPQPVAEGSLQTRYALYLHARQTGKWMAMLNMSNSVDDRRYGLDKLALNTLPPTFIAHSTRDTDVPFHIAQKLNNEIPVSQLHSVDHSEHDFDRDSQSELSKKVYSKLFDWLQQIN